MASSDAKPFSIKNTAYRVTFPIFDADGDLVAGAAGLDSEYSGDGGAFADCTNEAAEIAASSGMYYLDLTAGEMNYDTVAIIVKTSTSGAKTTPLVLYPVENTDIPVNVKAISDDATAADNLELITEITNITSLTVDASGHLECDVVEIEGADPTDTIRDSVVDDATRIDASALNTLSGHDPGGALCLDATPLTAAETESEVNDALVALHLDHLLSVDYDPASKPGTATALLNELIESDGGISRFTQNALEQGPDTTTALTLHSDYDAAKTAAPASEYDTEMGRITANVALASVCTETRLAELDAANLPTDIADVPTVAEFNARTQPTADYFDPAADAVANVTLVATTTTNSDMRGTDSAALASGVNCTQVEGGDATDAIQAAADAALVANHLDHLLKTTYDPAAKPGTADALLNELIESDAGVSRYTANALEEAPTGGSAPTVGEIADQVWDEAKSGHVGAGSFGEEVQAHATPAEVDTECDEALVNIHLDHLLAVDYDPASKPGVATALLNELVESDAGVSRFTQNALEEAPTGGSAPTVTEIRTEMDDNSTQLAAIVADTNELQTDDVPGLIGALNNISTAQVNTEMDTALSDIHLDHLLAVDYDPASKPGTATALLNELVENDGGASRFTENALEEAPTGGSAAAADIWAYGTRTLTQSAASVAAAVSGTDLSILRGDTLSVTITGLGDISGRTKLWFTIKEQTSDADTVSIVQIEETDGLLYINGGAAATSGNGDITVDDETAGDVTITLEAVEVAKLRPSNSLNYDIQVLDSSGVSTLSAADAVVPADVTRVVE